MADREADRKLKETLKDTFPASDPLSSNEVDEVPVRPVDRQPADLDRANVDKLAEEVRRKLGDGSSGTQKPALSEAERLQQTLASEGNVPPPPAETK